jgi:lipid-A-disaccharide synthase
MAKFCKELGLKTFYYISPSVWAWKESRVKKIKKSVDKMFVILPFEPEFYEKHDYPVSFHGHPLIDAISQFRKKAISKEDFINNHNLLNDKKIIALLPGSRKQEIKVKLPIMLDVVKEFPNYQFVIAGAPSLGVDFYQEFIKTSNTKLVLNDTYNLLNNAHAALVTSGTATLETALFKVPQVVCYKGNALSFQIAKRIVNIKYISLVNLIEDRKIVTELIQNDLTPAKLIEELRPLLEGKQREEMLSNYDKLIDHCGGEGASKGIAGEIVADLQTKI